MNPLISVSTCRACRAPLYLENVGVADGCPCNTARGANHGLVPAHVCTCAECDPAQTGSVRDPERATAQALAHLGLALAELEFREAELEKARAALVAEFVPPGELNEWGDRLSLPVVVAHACAHHGWHHDQTQDGLRVVRARENEQLRSERDALASHLDAVRAASHLFDSAPNDQLAGRVRHVLEAINKHREQHRAEARAVADKLDATEKERDALAARAATLEATVKTSRDAGILPVYPKSVMAEVAKARDAALARVAEIENGGVYKEMMDPSRTWKEILEQKTQRIAELEAQLEVSRQKFREQVMRATKSEADLRAAQADVTALRSLLARLEPKDISLTDHAEMKRLLAAKHPGESLLADNEALRAALQWMTREAAQGIPYADLRDYGLKVLESSHSGTALIDSARAEAAAREREECAKLVEESDPLFDFYDRSRGYQTTSRATVAAAIRARATPAPEGKP